jgi:hypothetical protein
MEKEKRLIKFVKKIISCLEKLKIKRYNSKYSKHTYNNWVHIILLALRQKLDKSYRAFCEIAYICTELLTLLKIKNIPHYTTLQKVAKQLNVGFLEKIIGGFLFLTMNLNIRSGIDGTGFQPTRASAYYTKIIKKDKKLRRKIRKHIKLTIFVDLKKQLIISQKIRRGPANDSPEFKPTIKKGKEILDKIGKKIKSVDADKGYDSEENHKLVVEKLNAEDRIRIKNKNVPIWRTKGTHRKKAKRRINRLRCNYRSLVETINSVLKRIEGSTVRSVNVGMQNREVLFKEIAYNADRLVSLLNSLTKDFY